MGISNFSPEVILEIAGKVTLGEKGDKEKRKRKKNMKGRKENVKKKQTFFFFLLD